MAIMQILNPATGSVLNELSEDTSESIQKKYRLLREGQPVWAKTPLAERKAAIERFLGLTEKRRDELAKTQSLETGKPISQATGEIAAVGGRIRFFLERVGHVLEPEDSYQEEGLRERITWDPLGIVLNISAWNYPWFVGSNVFIPALLTGNAVLYKPSELAANTGQAISDLLHEAGVPEDAFQIVQGDGRVGAELTSLPVSGVFFTGSYATGKKIAAAVAPKLSTLQLELGGKDPSYVCEDVDVKTTAASLADGAFYNAGQSCCSVERIYVHESIYKDFVNHFVDVVRGFRMGDPLDPNTYIGPLVNKAAVEKIEAQVEDAIEKGAHLLTGGKRPDRPGFWYEPTVFSDTNHEMLLMREESFGPIIGIQSVSGDDEAIRLMNDTKYGLTAGVFTNDAGRAEAILSQVNSGTAYWNCSDRVSPHVPWSGRGHSGLGCTLSEHGIRAFLQPRAWHLKAPAKG